MEKIKAVSPNMYVGLGYCFARSELRRLTKLASETGQEVAVIPHLVALKDVMDSIHPGIDKPLNSPPKYVKPPEDLSAPIKITGDAEYIPTAIAMVLMLIVGVAIGVQVGKVI